jgi:hypothetical protein
VVPPVFKTGLAGIAFAGRFDSFPPPPFYLRQLWNRRIFRANDRAPPRQRACAWAW